MEALCKRSEERRPPKKGPKFAAFQSAPLPLRALFRVDLLTLCQR